MSYHKTIIEGNVGRAPETRYTQSGDPVCNFSVAVTEKFGGKEDTTWYKVVCFKKTAEIAGQYVKKGGAVLIEGRMKSRQWDEKEGNKRESWDLRCDRLVLLGSRQRDDSQREESKPQESQSPGGFAGMDDDIPFMRLAHGAAWSVV